MTTIVFKVQTLASALDDVEIALETGKADATPQFNFVSWELMHKILSPKRLEIVQAMTGAGPLSIREISRRVGRDFKGVHSDATLLLNAGVINKTDKSKVVFPYDKIHIDFEISAAA
ncbi:transcriptional regulator [Phyllobacterium sp. 628]|uniref:HVO_A0114 family putative DNA-binding protein n=1 Tax=Phyllobacterium sp. 628 TaxID=2718938 RepID=UPI0016626533|nr:transcriptional regulator [Phyllobacterium sp. 628]QND53852.1 transcriptional regulator [Phyllobacterium sp. 628]